VCGEGYASGIMKKYILVSFFSFLLIILLGFNVNSANADVAGCVTGDNFSRTTGQACNATATVTGCVAGYLFSPVTGQSCIPISASINAEDNSSNVVQFNNLFKSGFKVGLNSNDVKPLQQFLKDEGYYFGKIDGKYGRITARAVKDFQDDSNIDNNNTTSTSSGSFAVPVISGVSGPKALNVNEKGTWTVSAYSPNDKGEGSTVSYSANWGDFSAGYLGISVDGIPFVQTSTFTHTYVTAGVYTPIFTVKDYTGQTAYISLSVSVRNRPTTFPAGCASASGYSSTTGESCDGNTMVQPSILSCSNLQQTQSNSFNVCKNDGFENVCFSKSGVYQGCTNNINNDCTVNNVNSNVLCSVGVTQPTIIASTSAGGTISPSGNISVSAGSNKTFTFIPNTGYQVGTVTVDGISVSITSSPLSYTFFNVTGSHIIGVIFSPVTTQPLITKIDPDTVYIGNSVNIIGTGFTTDSDNSICYAGVIGLCYKVRATSTTSLVFNIPYSEFPTTVGIYVTNLNGTSNVYRSLTLINARVSISNISPTSALSGATITITGSGFAGFSSGINKIYLGTNELSFINASATSLQFIVPSITPGIYELYVKNNNGESNKINFTVVAP